MPERLDGTKPADLPPAQPILGIEAASKSFGDLQALHEVSLDLYPGEVHGLVGNSRAGKSTLVKVLGGECELDSGRFMLDGAPTVLRGAAAAHAVGASIIHQWPPMLLDMDVAENIFRGRQPIGAGPGFDRAEMRRRADLIFARLGVELDPARPARALSAGDKQIVEVARAVSLNARVILMDESTAPLNPIEVNRLFQVIRALRDDGAAVLFVSLFMNEIFAICERVSIIRGGRLVRTATIGDVTSDQIIHLASGRKLGPVSPTAGATSAGVVLDVEGLGRDGVFSDVSLQVSSGELVALTGVADAGCAEVARAVFGTDRHDAGHVKVRGHDLPNGSPESAMDAGIVFVPGERSRPDLTRPRVDTNVDRAARRRMVGQGLVRRARQRLPARRWTRLLQAKYDWVDNPGMPSVVNQLEALATAPERRPSVLILDEPTRGLNKGLKAQAHWLLDDLALDGVAILMVSSDLPEVVGMADRILVLRAGTVTADLTHVQAHEASIMRAAMGQPMGWVP